MLGSLFIEAAVVFVISGVFVLLFIVAGIRSIVKGQR